MRSILKSILEEWEDLITSYNKDNAYIRSLKRKWITPKKRKYMGKMLNEMNNQNDEEANSSDGPAILPKKKSSPKSPSQKKGVSPVMQVMKAVAKAAQAPAGKKKPAIKPGPSKANLKNPQKKGRIDKGDGPSAEEDGEA